MRDGRDLRSYDYVNHPYDQVCRRLLADPTAVFRRATTSAAAAARALGAELRVKVAGVDIGAEIDLRVTGVEDAVSPFSQPAIKVHLAWEAARHASWFPTMVATLWVYPLSSTETQLELEGRYQPPLGPVGDAIDALVLHRLAKHSVKTLVAEVAAWLRDDLAANPAKLEADVGA